MSVTLPLPLAMFRLSVLPHASYSSFDTDYTSYNVLTVQLKELLIYPPALSSQLILFLGKDEDCSLWPNVLGVIDKWQ